MTTPTIKSYDEFCARRKLTNTTGDVLLYRSKFTGSLYNNISITYEHTYDTVTTTTSTNDEQGVPVVTSETNKTSVNHKIDIVLNNFVTLDISESIGNVHFTLLNNIPLDIKITYDGSNFIYDSQIVKMGSFLKTNNIVVNIPKCDPLLGDSIIIKVENVTETFQHASLTDLISIVNTASKTLFMRNNITNGDQQVLNLGSNTAPTSTNTIISGTIDNNRSKDVYSNFNLEGGIGLPQNISDIFTGPTPLVHINYSERENDVVVLAKIFKVVNQKYSLNT